MALTSLSAFLSIVVLAATSPPHASAQESAPASSASGQSEPEWIWSHAEPGNDESCWFFHGFDAGNELESADLWTSCDNELELFINGRLAAENEEWSVAVHRDIRPHLVAGGRNRIAARGTNTNGPAGFWFELELTYADGARQRITSDASWLSSRDLRDGWSEADFEPALEEWQPSVSFGILGEAPWGSPTGFVDGLPARALAASELELAPGFVAELVYNVPRKTQGSWVSLAEGPQGTLFASDQYGSIYRIVPSAPGEGERGTRVQALDLSIGQAQGLLWAFDCLYFVGGTGGAGSGLYRATDSDGDGELDQVELLRALEGDGEHGPHAVRLAPDGRSLYVIAGNHTELPELARSRVPLHWGEDQLLERTPDPRGHAVGKMAPGGWLCRVDPDGENWELVACGMRNAYDFDFDDDGEIFTFDSDMEWDVGLPWYRPARVLHLVSGADFGWRNGSGKWPATYPDSWPAVLDLGLASPTGVEFAPASFQGEWRDALLVADWAYGTIWGVQLTDNAGTKSGKAVRFAQGKPLPVTDLVASADGSLYVTTGGRRTQSGLYRIRSVQAPDESLASAAKVERDTNSVRRRMETMHQRIEPRIVNHLWTHLAAPDPFERRAARIALEHQDFTIWRERAFAENDPDIALGALLALARCADEDLCKRLVAALARLPVATFHDESKIAALRLYSLISIRQGPLTDEQRAQSLALFDPLYPSASYDLNRELCLVLVELEASGVIERSLDLHDRATRQEERIHYLFTLKSLRKGWTPELWQRYFAALDEGIATFAGGASLKAYLEGARATALEGVEEANRALYARAESAKANAEVAAVPAAFVRAWTLADFASDLDQDWKARDLENGRRLLARATCLTCHRFGAEGGSTGPDLRGAGSRFNARDLLETILLPSATISDQYQETELWTVEDKLFVGRIEEETEDVIWLRTLPPEEARLAVAKSEIDLRRPHPFSRMPEGLIDTLKREEVLDLLASLIAGLD